MTAIIKNTFRIQNARDFLENLTEISHTSARNHYLFIGKPLPWGAGTSQEELYPVAPIDTQEQSARIWDEMLALKKITDSTACLVVPRSDWDPAGSTDLAAPYGTVYAIYDDTDPNLYRQPTPNRISKEQNIAANRRAGTFYVLTDEGHVFICLQNNNGDVSRLKPKRPEDVTALVDYSDLDGYVWKYITTLRQSDVVKYLTDSWMPIRTLPTLTEISTDVSHQYQVQQSAVPGQVLSFVIDEKGSGLNTFTGTVTNRTLYTDGSRQIGTAKLSATTFGSPSTVSGLYTNHELHIIDGPSSVKGNVYKIVYYNAAMNSGDNEIRIDEPWPSEILNESVNVTIQILPKFTIETNGTEAAKGRLVVINGAVERVVIFDRGRDATFARATVDTSNSQGAVKLRPVLSSTLGLGKDPEKDLGAFFVMLNAKLQYDESDFPSTNDYRQIGIIRDVYERISAFPGKQLATANTLVATKSLAVENIAAGPVYGVFQPDEIVESTDSSGKTVSAKIIDYTPSQDVNGQGTITFIQTPETGYGTFQPGGHVVGLKSGCAADIISPNGVQLEEVAKFNGEILYIEHRRPVLRSPEQIEDIKAIIEF